MELADLSVRDKVWLIEDEIKKLQQVICPLKHYFSRGICAREMFIPAGTTVTGHIHKYEQINILSAGDISVLTEDGIVRVQAPFTVISPAGTKRIAYAHTDCVWTTILRSDDITDPDKLEDHFVVKTDQEYLDFLNEQKLIEAT